MIDGLNVGDGLTALYSQPAEVAAAAPSATRGGEASGRTTPPFADRNCDLDAVSGRQHAAEVAHGLCRASAQILDGPVTLLMV